MALTKPCPKCGNNRVILRDDSCIECIETALRLIDYSDRGEDWREGKRAIMAHQKKALHGEAA